MSNEPLTKKDWADKIAPYHLPSQFAEPIARIWDRWEASLEELLEVLKFAMLCPYHDVLASAFVGQLLCESGMGKHRECLLGQKATASDVKKGDFIRVPTLELLSDLDIARIKVDGDFISFTGNQSKDGSRKEIRCYQKFFHPKDSEDPVPADFERWIHFYEAHKPNRFQFLQAGTRSFLSNVTCTQPWAYATGDAYVESVMAFVDEFKLQDLDLPKA